MVISAPDANGKRRTIARSIVRLLLWKDAPAGSAPAALYGSKVYHSDATKINRFRAAINAYGGEEAGRLGVAWAMAGCKGMGIQTSHTCKGGGVLESVGGVAPEYVDEGVGETRDCCYTISYDQH